MSAYNNIIIDHASLTFNRYDVPQYHQCEFDNVYQVYKHGLPYREVVRCGANALYVVTRTSVLTGNTYTSHACENHVKEWEKAEGVKDLRNEKA